MSQQSAQPELQAVEDFLRAAVARLAGVPEAEIDVRAPFDEYGLDSMEVIDVTAQLEKLRGQKLPPTLLYEYPSIRELATHLTSLGQSLHHA